MFFHKAVCKYTDGKAQGFMLGVSMRPDGVSGGMSQDGTRLSFMSIKSAIV